MTAATRVLGILTASVLFAPALALGAGHFDTIVDGQNDPAVDVPAVQAAVDAGGRVLLRGTFDFGEAVGEPYEFIPNPPANWTYVNGPSHLPANGTLANSKNPAFWASPPRTVFVTTDVEIHGDDSTSVVGGYRTFTVGYRPLPGHELLYDMNTDDGHLGPTTATLNDYPITPVRVTIANIHFVRSLNASIWLAATRDETRIFGNRFSDNRPLLERYWFGRQRANAVYTQGGVAAINFFTYLDTNVSAMQDVLPRSDGIDSRTGTAVQGDLIIADNVVETDVGGLLYFVSVGGDVSVTGNHVRGGLTPEQSVGAFGYFGHTVIRDNFVEGLLPMRVSEDSLGRNHPDTEAAGRTWSEGDWERASTEISHNTLVSLGLGGLEVLISKNVEVRSNTVQASLFPGAWADAISLWRSHDSVVRSNRIRGSAIFGLDLAESTGNVLVGNDLNQFTPQPLFPFLPVVHLAFLFGADDNTAVGGGLNPKKITYLEFGSEGNVVTGFGPIAGQFSGLEGNVVADAMRRSR